jgi:putative addiction module killer protein
MARLINDISHRSLASMVTNMIPFTAVTLTEYLDDNGRSPFGCWLDVLDSRAAAKVIVALARIKKGNFSNVKGVGGGVLEYRIDFGPGYRIYFGKDGEALVILLAGGTKNRQQDDIRTAQARWNDYKRRKAQES